MKKKEIACSHRHASTAGMEMLTRTAIGIINNTERKSRKAEKTKKGEENSMKRGMKTMKRLKMMVF